MNAATFLTGLLRGSAQAGVLVMLVLALQWILRNRITPRWRCALWLLVMLRLLLPISWSSAVSVFNLLPRWPASAAGLTVRTASMASKNADPSRKTEPIQQASQKILKAQPSASIVPEPREDSVEMPPRLEATALGEAPPALQATTPSLRVDWPLILLLLWFVGAALLAVYIGMTSIALAKRFRDLVPVTEPAVLEILDECARRMGVRQLSMAECPDVASPALHGFLRPRLLLPVGFAATFSKSELRFVFLHELAHVKRRDIPLNWLAAGLQIIHWFNPFIWLGFARWRADRELACDALALETAGAEQNQEYGRTILRLLEGITQRVSAPNLVGILEDKRELKRRIGMIANFRPEGRWGIISLAVLLALGTVFLTDAENSRSESGNHTNQTTVKAGSNASSKTERLIYHGEDPLPSGSETTSPTHSLLVTVLDANTGKPIENAEIAAPYSRIDNFPRRLTDTAGKYLMRIPIPSRASSSQIPNVNYSVSHPEYAGRGFSWVAVKGNVYDILPDEVTVRLEKGVPIGGVVLDALGKPMPSVRVGLQGSGYTGFRTGDGEPETKSEQYPNVSTSANATNATAVTDAGGKWIYAHFPSDLQSVEVTLVRPDDSREVFSTRQDFAKAHRPVELAALISQTARFTLREGITVHGIVVDETGKPLAGVSVKEAYGHGNVYRVADSVTGPDGRFERQNRTPRQWIYTASRDDLATSSVIAQVAAGMPEVRLVMTPPKPIHLRIQDVEGKPIAGASVLTDSIFNEGQILKWRGIADADGRVIWTNAPAVPVVFQASARGLAGSKQFRASGAVPETVVTLNPQASEKIKLHFRVSDSITRQPAKVSRVMFNKWAALEPARMIAEPMTNEFSIEVKLSEFRPGWSSDFSLYFEAPGFETGSTEKMNFRKGDQDLDLVLISGAPAEGVIALPDGRPADGAWLWIRPPERPMAKLHLGDGRGSSLDPMTRVLADANGKFTLPIMPGNQPLVITHGRGYLESTIGEIKRTPQVRLQPWGRVQGRALVAGQPRVGMQVCLTSTDASMKPPVYVSERTISDVGGSFAFSDLPPGEYTLYRQYLSIAYHVVEQSHPQKVVVGPGEIVKVDYGIAGRQISGQAVLEGADAEVDWLNDYHFLKSDSATDRPLNREDFATNKNYLDAESALKRRDQPLQYLLVFSRNGSFQIDDVPPGTYELCIEPTKPADDGRHRVFIGRARPEDVLGSLVRTIVVPPGNESLDLGRLVLPARLGAAAKLSPEPRGKP